MIRVAYLEDEEYAGLGVKLVLESHEDLELVGIADTHDSFLELVESERPDIVIVDLVMRGDPKSADQSIELIRTIKSQLPATICLVLTGRPNLERFQKCLSAGAEGFVTKFGGPGFELPATIRLLSSGGRVYDPELFDRLMAVLPNKPNNTGTDDLSNHQKELSEREREVLGLVAQGLSNSEIAEKLVISLHTVKAHLRNIRSKLGVTERSSLKLMALGMNLESRDRDADEEC